MPTQQDISAIVDHIYSSVDKFSRGLSVLEQTTYKGILSDLRDLSVDKDGNVIQNIKNLNIVNKVRGRLLQMVNNKTYKGKVSDLENDFSKITELQNNYFANAFVDFKPPKLLNELNNVAFDETKDSLLSTGIKENVINEAVDIVSSNVKSGSSINEMADELKEFLVSGKGKDGKLVSYTKQIIGDTISQHAANYNKIITDDLDLQWYEYVGAIIKTTRPLCKKLVQKRFVHESELGAISRGVINGQQVSTAGMIPGTDKDNFQINRGGYNCQHLLIPISKERVPSDLRKKFEPRNTSKINLSE